MSVEQRVKICRLLEKIKFQEEYSEKIGVENLSTYRGEKLNNEKDRAVT